MKTIITVVASMLFVCGPSWGQSAPETKALKVYAQGNTDLLPMFVEECEREFANEKIKMQLVRFEDGFQYNIVIAQETTAFSAAAAVIVLDNKGRLVTSVVRSGRMSGKGALNASAKELAKKLAALSPENGDH